MLIWQKYLKVLGQVPSTLPSSTSKYQVLLNFKVSSTSKYQVLEILHQVPSIKYKYFTWPQPWNVLYESRMKWTWHHSKLAVEEVSFFGGLRVVLLQLLSIHDRLIERWALRTWVCCSYDINIALRNWQAGWQHPDEPWFHSTGPSEPHFHHS